MSISPNRAAQRLGLGARCAGTALLIRAKNV